MNRFAIGLGAILTLAAGNALAQGADAGLVNEKLREVERALKVGREKARRLGRQADSLVRELEQARLERIKQAGQMQKLEAESTRIELALTRLDADEAKKKFFIKTRRRAFSDVLMTMHRLALHPAEALIARPGTPSQLVRTAIVLRATVPRFNALAKKMRAELDGLTKIRQSVIHQRHRLEKAESRLAAQRHRLDGLLADRAARHQLTLKASKEESKRLAGLAGRAKDLRDLFNQLRMRQKPQNKKPVNAGRSRVKLSNAPFPLPRRASRPISQVRGRLPFPVAGRITRRYGETRRAGTGRKGITISARPHAQVIAPYDGIVAFAEKFRSYGRLLIIDHGEGYHTLLAGFARIDVAAGQGVLAGEPAGIMGLSRGGGTSLYFELRHKGKSINPIPWLVAQKIR